MPHRPIHRPPLPGDLRFSHVGTAGCDASWPACAAQPEFGLRTRQSVGRRKGRIDEKQTRARIARGRFSHGRPSRRPWGDRLSIRRSIPRSAGNPLNSSHLLSLSSAQRGATAWDANSSSSGSGGSTGSTTGTTAAELFVSQLQGRLLSALASQVTEAIFGDDPQQSGTVQFGDTTVTFNRSLDSITLTIDDTSGSTTIVVPLLVVN